MRLLDLFVIFAPLSLVAVGGANGVVPDIHRQVVVVHQWMTETEFASAFVLAQAVPGPNILVVSLIGWHVDGLGGAIVALVAMCGPSSVLALAMTRILRSPRATPWRRRVQMALSPLAVGLVLASGLVLARSADHVPAAVVATLATALLLLRTNIHPLVLMAAGAALGLLGVI